MCNSSSSYDKYSSLLSVVDNLAELQQLNITSCTDVLHFLLFYYITKSNCFRGFLVTEKDIIVLYMYIKNKMFFVIIKTIHDLYRGGRTASKRLSLLYSQSLNCWVTFPKDIKFLFPQLQKKNFIHTKVTLNDKITLWKSQFISLKSKPKLTLFNQIYI